MKISSDGSSDYSKRKTYAIKSKVDQKGMKQDLMSLVCVRLICFSVQHKHMYNTFVLNWRKMFMNPLTLFISQFISVKNTPQAPLAYSVALHNSVEQCVYKGLSLNTSF